MWEVPSRAGDNESEKHKTRLFTVARRRNDENLHSPNYYLIDIIGFRYIFLFQNANAQAALQAAQGQGVQTQGAETQGGPNTVLRVIIEHMIYPISLDILYQVMQHFFFLFTHYIPTLIFLVCLVFN